MQKPFLIIICLAFLPHWCFSQLTVLYPLNSRNGYGVYIDENLEKDKDGLFLIRGKLSTDNFVQLKSIFLKKQLIRVHSGDIIEFRPYVESTDGKPNPLNGTLVSCVIRNKKGVWLPTQGFNKLILFPYGTVVYFSASSGCQSLSNLLITEVERAILGGNCDIPAVGNLKKGTEIRFSCDINADGNKTNRFSIDSGKWKTIK